MDSWLKCRVSSLTVAPRRWPRRGSLRRRRTGRGIAVLPWRGDPRQVPAKFVPRHGRGIRFRCQRSHKRPALSCESACPSATDVSSDDQGEGGGRWRRPSLSGKRETSAGLRRCTDRALRPGLARRWCVLGTGQDGRPALEAAIAVVRRIRSTAMTQALSSAITRATIAARVRTPSLTKIRRR
jgi:hypothetical protein